MSGETDSHSHHVVVPLSIPRCLAAASLPRSHAILEPFGAVSWARGPSRVIRCAHTNIIVNHSQSVNTVGIGRLGRLCADRPGLSSRRESRNLFNSGQI